MQTVEVTTVIFAPPSRVYEFLLDFPGYAQYSEHLRSVEEHGDGGPGTEYALTFAWWKLDYTVHTEVTGVEPPHEIAWRVTKDVNARGAWELEGASDEAPEGVDAATRVTLRVEYHPKSFESASVSLPPLVSQKWVLGKLTGLLVDEGRQVVEQVAADLEGDRRHVPITVRVDGDVVYDE